MEGAAGSEVRFAHISPSAEAKVGGIPGVDAEVGPLVGEPPGEKAGMA
jgi:hypothetical protein